ncbi:MAG: pyrroloquinoline quinone-dependent dehydrogenase, partial [Ginsengibacter sp.]
MQMRLYPPMIFVALIIITSSCKIKSEETYKNWNVYGGSKDASHYSSLTEVDTNNVTNLQVAWVYATGDIDTSNHSQMQCNPIVIDEVMYVTSPKLKLLALNAASGKQIWSFDPATSIVFDSSDQAALPMTFSNNCRGVTYWTDGKDDKRIFYTAGYNLLCV